MSRLSLDRFDLIVVGCGPAGASTATAAARHGLSVMVVDRRRSVGMPPRCSGYVPEWFRSYTDFDDGAVLQRVHGLRHYDGDGRCLELGEPGFVLDRTRLDKTLAIQALEAGADLANATVLRRSGTRVVVRRNGREAEFEGRYIVGADGPSSVIARSIGVNECPNLATLPYEVGVRDPRDWCELYAHLAGHGCPGWFVPCGRTARVGVALPQSRAGSLKTHMRAYLDRLASEGLVHGDAVLEATGGLVPAAGREGPLQDGHVILTGAAGGVSQPFGGCGIAAAVASGWLAGATVGRAVRDNDTAAVLEYEDAVLQLRSGEIGPPLGDGGRLSRILKVLSDWYSREAALLDPGGRAC